MQMFDRETFFDHVRTALFHGRMTQSQVDGQEGILTTWESFYPSEDLRWLGYCLATSFHETGETMQPIEEWGKGEGKPYGVEDHETEQTYYGRGFVQLTWRDNYARTDRELDLTADRSCEWHADNALELDIATRVLFRGCAQGWFRTHEDGKPETLGRYFNETTDDPYNAREIINGDKGEVGKKIEGYHDEFLDALNAALAAYEPETGAVLNDYDTYQIRVRAGTPIQFLRVMSEDVSFPITPKDATPAPDTPDAEPIYRGRRRPHKRRWS